MRLLIRKILKSRGRDLIKYEPRLIDFLEHRKIDVVVDVGANTGQFAALLRKDRYAGRIISLEPIASVFEQLQTTAAGDPLWTTLNLAAGAHNGTAEIGVSDDTVFSSMLAVNRTASDFDPRARVVARETIQVRRLDELLADLQGRIFLKIDTQGFEAQVLDGAGEWMSRVAGVQMELPCVHLYDGVWTMSQAMAAMERLGFTLFQARPVNVSKTDSIAPIELDCVFGRPG